MDVLEVNREEVEHRTEGRHEENRNRGCYSKMAVGQQTRRHEWIARIAFDNDERPEQQEAQHCAGDDARRSPAERRALDKSEHEQRDAKRGTERARHVEPALRIDLAIAT